MGLEDPRSDVDFTLSQCLLCAAPTRSLTFGFVLVLRRREQKMRVQFVHLHGPEKNNNNRIKMWSRSRSVELARQLTLIVATAKTPGPTFP